MWTRFKRAVRSFVGFFVSSVEDPELILQQNVRDMNDQVPRMNENIAMVRANVTLLEKENGKFRSELVDLTAKIKAAINANRDDLAGGYAIQLQSLQGHLARNEAQLEGARAAYDKAVQLKKVFLAEKEKKTREAMQAIRDHRRAQWQSKVADALESFQVAGIDQTHDEMIRKIEERTAFNEARMQMALEAVDGTTVQIEEEAQKIRAQELVQRFKQEMGVIDTVDAQAIPLPARSLERKS
ncbi:PspA/IM30 family protein [Vulgatibacter sp.]|uniref:PspA/IM30 family protein n=1 Tax=Vulgatibacter sp. TaxID=1971226 RepID=UPI003568C851